MTDNTPKILSIEELAELVKNKEAVEQSLDISSTIESIDVDTTPGKKLISLRLDKDVIDWFKDQGKGYQSRMNAVLRAYMKAKK